MSGHDDAAFSSRFQVFQTRSSTVSSMTDLGFSPVLLRGPPISSTLVVCPLLFMLTNLLQRFDDDDREFFRCTIAPSWCLVKTCLKSEDET